jgi:hypothetical protein
MTVKLANNAVATLAAGISAVATSLSVTAGQGAQFPALGAGDYFYATLLDPSNNIEIVKVTARLIDVFTIERGQDGTAARAYNAGDTIRIRLTRAAFDRKVDKERKVNTAGGIQGGGDLEDDLSLSLTDTGVTAATYGSKFKVPVIVVDAKGRITGLTEATLDKGSLGFQAANLAGDTFTGAVVMQSGLSVTGTVNVTGAIVASGDVTAFSDEKFKTNWRPLAPDFVEQLAGVKHGIYDRTDIELTQVGVSAQSLQQVMPDAVREEAGNVTVAYSNAALTACIELAQRVVALEKALAERA